MKNEELGRWYRFLSFFILHSKFFILLPLILLPFALLSCKTVGISMTSGGYAEVSPQIANEMLLDSRQVVILDVRPAAAFRGAEGYIAGAVSAPFEGIERQLPELLPYQNQTVLVYGANDEEGTLAARLLALAGFRNVVHVAGGLAGWIENGYRTVNSR
ncbi:MAG TPA: rhodanese-like domain-containing protein [Thermoanaerobaculia bacterium]